MGSLRFSISKSDTDSLWSMTSVSNGDPHPRDFEPFMDWVFRKFNIPNITVKRFSKAEYIPVAFVAPHKKHKIPLKSVSVAVIPVPRKDLDKKVFPASTKQFMRHLHVGDDAILSAYYDTNSFLVEIAFIDCLVPIPMEIFMIIQLCLPYNPQLTRITWKGAHLTSFLVYEISKILPGSEITDVVFDGCDVPEGNYYLLLDKASNLKYLSLTNCEINDEVCVMIAERLQRNHPAAENLVALDLSSNRITDVGAEALGRSLRTNRRLLYLNLCNNSITSVGAAHILTPLTKFKLSSDENRDIHLLKFKLAAEKLARNDECLKEVTNVRVNFDQRRELKEKKAKLKKKMSQSRVDCIGNELVSDNSDIYLATLTEENKGAWYSSGNLTLCALNLAYNRLDFATVSKILDVVLYQYNENKLSKTGLLRVVIEGNLLPQTCMEYDLISKYIDLAIGRMVAMQPPIFHLTKSKMKISHTDQRSEHRMK